MHTKSPSFSISKIVYCNEEEPEKSGVCLSSEFDVGLPVTYFEKLDLESNKAQADTLKKCSAKTAESIEVFNGFEGYKGTRLKNPTCKSWKKQMIAIVGEKDHKIEVLNFGKIEEAKKKEAVAKLLPRYSWYPDLLKENPSFSNSKKMKILKLTHQKIDYYVVTITDQTPSEVIFGSIASLELINGNNSSGELISSFIINKKPLVWIGMCAKETDGCQDYFFELTK